MTSVNICNCFFNVFSSSVFFPKLVQLPMVKILEPHELATVLDESFGIQARAGLHCAPGVHRAAGTFESGGTLRLSVGPFTTAAEIDATCAAVAAVTAG